MPDRMPLPQLADYEQTRRSFDWAAERSRLDGLPDGRGLNIAYEAIDRHVVAGGGAKVAIRWLPRRGDAVDLTYEDLRLRTNRFANVLEHLGFGPGARVATLTGRVPDLYVAALGTLKAGAVYTPLFSAFGPEPIRQRIDIGSIDVLITTPRLFGRKVTPILDQLPSIGRILLTGEQGIETAPDWEDDRVLSLESLLATVGDSWTIPATDPETPALLHFTSGTTGKPKGVIHVHEAVVSHHASGAYVLDLTPDDVFWCTADPGWVTGTSYGIISPLTHGVTSIIDEGDFDADRWYSVIEQQRVDVWYTAPTAIRMMMKVGRDTVQAHDISSLRLVASVGEPLNPEAVRWAQDEFKVPILDNWWQTETGSIMIANYRSEPVRPGSMGRPLPGIEAGLLERDANGEIVIDGSGHPVEVHDPDRSGELALRSGWPSMFRGYLNQQQRYADCFVDGWYRSGDLARRDADGYFWFVGRDDDVIKSAGHLIGPFEVESALMEHPAVSEAAVIGKPHETMGNTVKAFVTLGAQEVETDDLKADLMAHARRRLGAAVAPREIDVVAELPHTRSGKIMRRLLKAKELGLEQGDVSTLETALPKDGAE
ncbi:MAG: acetate--CoA ligase [Acidimicrobiales bacterium]